MGLYQPGTAENLTREIKRESYENDMEQERKPTGDEIGHTTHPASKTWYRP